MVTHYHVSKVLFVGAQLCPKVYKANDKAIDHTPPHVHGGGSSHTTVKFENRDHSHHQTCTLTQTRYTVLLHAQSSSDCSTSAYWSVWE